MGYDPTGEFALTAIAIFGIIVSAAVGGTVAGISTAMGGGSVGEIIASSFIGALTAGGVATVAAIGAAGTMTVGAVALLSGGIGAAGEIASISVEYAFHKDDPGYAFDWGSAAIRVAYAAGLSALAGSISFGLNRMYTGTDEIIGFAISAEVAIAMGAVDFGVRQLISVIPSSSAQALPKAASRRCVIGG